MTKISSKPLAVSRRSAKIASTHQYCLREIMNKGELVQTVASKTGLSQKEVNAIISVLTETIEDAVADGDKVTLVGFGTFEPRERQAREGRNPRTGKPMQIPATTVPAFSAGKLFKEKVAS